MIKIIKWIFMQVFFIYLYCILINLMGKMEGGNFINHFNVYIYTFIRFDYNLRKSFPIKNYISSVCTTFSVVKLI